MLRSLGGTHRYGAKSSAANSQVVGGGVLQWHVDGAFYRACTIACTSIAFGTASGFALALTAVAHALNACAEKMPPAVTALHCVEAPSSPPQTFSFDDAAPLNFKAGATAYVSAAAAFVRLLASASFARRRQTLTCKLGALVS